MSKEITEKELRRKTWLSFAGLFAWFLFAILFWKWLQNSPHEMGTLSPLRSVLKINEKIFSSLLYSNKHTAPLYNKNESAGHVRVNGYEGLRSPLDTSSWRLNIIRKSGDTLHLTLDDIKALPKVDVIYNFKCVEGWNQISHWGGARFSDLAAKYRLGTTDGNNPDMNNYSNLYTYAGLLTPDSGYYVGMDMPSMLHPQTLLCYEMNGKPLPLVQGYPLRLITPVKYGVKSLKRIGTIFFSNDPPPDYWAQRGYDYYLGL